MNETLKIGSLAILLASVGVVGTANAFGGGQRGGEMPSFEELDTDGDGVVSAEELAAHADARFDDHRRKPPASVPFFRNDDEESLFLRLYGKQLRD